jgi:hypothetical protein
LPNIWGDYFAKRIHREDFSVMGELGEIYKVLNYMSTFLGYISGILEKRATRFVLSLISS